MAKGLGAALPEQIHLNGGVDGDHVVDLADDVRIVDIVHRMHLDHRVFVHEFEEALCPQGEGAETLATVDGLAGIVNCAGEHQIDYAVGHQLGVYSQILLGDHCLSDCIGYASPSHLQG